MKKRLFSVFLALCMILTMAPAAFAAEQEDSEVPVTEGAVTEGTTGEDQASEENVAEVNGTEYATLAEAVEAVIESDGESGTVTLLKDTSGGGIGLFNSKEANDVDLTIDFGGFTYTCQDPAVGSSGTESQGFHFEKGNTVTLKNGTIKVDSNSTGTKMLIQNYCNLTLEDLTLEGANVTQYLISSNYGDVTLKNVNASGTYTGDGGVVAIDLMHWLNDSYRDKAPTMTIENSAEHKIMGTIVKPYCYDSGVKDCESKPTLTINGGTYFSDVSEYLAEGLDLIHNDDGTYTVGTLDAGNAFAEVNGKYYSTLAEAIDNAKAGQTVKVLKNQTLSGTQAISEGITLDLGGKTLTIAGTHTDAGISLAQGASAEGPMSVTIQNGTIKDVRGEGKAALGANTLFVQGAVNLTTRDLTVQAYAPAGKEAPYYNYLLRISPDQDSKVGSLTLESGTKLEELENSGTETYGVVGVTAFGAYKSSDIPNMPENYEGVKVVIKDGVSIETTGYALSGNGANHGTTFVIEGGSLASTGSTGIYHPQKGTMTITGSPVISGLDAGIELRAGEMTVNGGTISGLDTPVAVTPNGNGTTSSGVGIAVAQHTTKLPIKVTISGGAVNGYSAFYESNPQHNGDNDLAKIHLSIQGGAFKATNGGSVAIYSEDKTAFITGGTFSSDPSAYVADGKIAVVQNGMYAIQEKNTTAPAEVVVGKPKPDVSAIPQEKKDAVTAAVEAIKADGLTGEANGQANQNTVTVEEGKSALQQAGVSVDSATVTIVVQPYLDIKAKAVSDTEMVLEITPRVRTVATTADLEDGDSIVMEGDSPNAVQMGSDEKLGVTTNITLTVPLLDGFVGENGDLFVEHVKDDGRTYVYKATVTEASGKKTAAFTTTRGFSTFRLVKEDISVAEVEGTYFASLQAAVDDVHDGGTIKLTKNATEAVTVSREVVFTIDPDGKAFDPGLVSAGSGYTLSREGNTFTVKKASSGGSGGSGPTSYTITVNDTKGGAVKVSHTRASKGSTVTITVTPDDGYALSNITAKDKNGNKVALTEKNEHKYTFKMPASKVTVEASFTAVDEKIPFTDISEGAYYYDAVLWAVEKGITTGTSDTTFSPDLSCTRAEMVTFLWRAAGSPTATATNPFSDVSSGAYYYDAVLWAVAQGITTGTSATTFSPDAIVTRGQTVTFLYRANGSPTATGSNPFTDVAADAYYADAVLWAVSKGITNGTSSTTFSPNMACSRGQIVTFLYRSMA